MHQIKIVRLIKYRNDKCKLVYILISILALELMWKQFGKVCTKIIGL